MKEMELRAAAVCGFCHEKIDNSSMPLFYRVRIERHGIKLDAVNRQTGPTMMLGGSARLAQVMGCDEEMTMPMPIYRCPHCAVDAADRAYDSQRDQQQGER